jgi:hypothetical protein
LITHLADPIEIIKPLGLIRNAASEEEVKVNRRQEMSGFRPMATLLSCATRETLWKNACRANSVPERDEP